MSSGSCSMTNLVQTYIEAGLRAVDVTAAREDGVPDLWRRLRMVHRVAAGDLAFDLARLSGDAAFERARDWQRVTALELMAWGFSRDTAEACAGGVAGDAMRALAKHCA